MLLVVVLVILSVLGLLGASFSYWMNADLASVQAMMDRQQARIAELEAKLAEAQKDAARLDYVATGKVTVSRDNGGFQLAWYDHNSQKLKWQNSWHETARAAIDAALAQREASHE